MNIIEAVRKATQALGDQMEAEGVVPAEEQNVQYTFDPESKAFTLTVITVPAGDCQHTAGLSPIAVLNDGKVAMVMHCPICKKVIA